MLPLKIFEQRYIDMAKACLADERPFGVCLITQGEEVAAADAAPPEFATIGTLARIVDWDMPQLGILHVDHRGRHALPGAAHTRRARSASSSPT